MANRDDERRGRDLEREWRRERYVRDATFDPFDTSHLRPYDDRYRVGHEEWERGRFEDPDFRRDFNRQDERDRRSRDDYGDEPYRTRGEQRFGYGDRDYPDRWRSERDYEREPTDPNRVGLPREGQRSWNRGYSQAAWRPRQETQPYGEPNEPNRRMSEEDERSFFERMRDYLVGATPGVRPSHRGKGPKGYRRSDERLLEEVCERLQRHEEVDASDVTVTLQGGECTLDGTVPTRREKHLAEQIAADVDGVIDVHNHLRIRRDVEKESVAAPSKERPRRGQSDIS